jgi:FkbM family methyltransferase
VKVYIDIGTNSMGGYEKLIKELGIDNTWYKVFVEPNPECYEYIEKQIGNDVNSKLIKGGCYYQDGVFELITRDDMKGDSAATLLGDKFIKDSIGSVNQENPSYNRYTVNTYTLANIIDSIDYSEELYIKMDCEGAEYGILDNLEAKYIPRIKKLYVEFHAHDEAMRNHRDKIIDNYSRLNIQILNWD